MTTIEAEIRIMEMFGVRQNLIVPNVTTFSGLVDFETDMLIISKSGYATGVEIKVSLSDLRADKRKKHISKLGTEQFNEITPRFQYFNKLKTFYYAVPTELIGKALIQIPEFAGVIDLSLIHI